MATTCFDRGGDDGGGLAKVTPALQKSRFQLSPLGKINTVEYFVLLFGDTRLAA